MSTLNINDLYSSINDKNFKRMKKFDDILLQIHRRIKYHAELEQTYCLYCILLKTLLPYTHVCQ